MRRCVEKQSSAFQNFHSSFMFYFELSSLALKTRLLIHSLECKSKFVVNPQQQPAAAVAATRTIRRRISPDDQVYSRGISISNAARPARLGETFSRSLSIHFFERAPRAINLDRAKTRVMQHLAAGWLACACACIELNIIFSLMNFPHKSCTFNFNAFEKCVSMLNS